MFEITADDIALLNDEDLRTLVARLCESEMRRREISASCVTWGGNQNAADGGVDVRVTLPTEVATDGFIPRPSTVFQVKAEDIGPSEIGSEMRPKGALRQSIKDLAANSGAYIIVSSKGSTSDIALENRRQAMKEAVSELPDRDKLKLDFYDRRRLETWVREHLGIGLWVRERIGKPIPGWSPYGAWSYSPAGVGSEYLIDGEVRIRTGREDDGPGLSVGQGINGVRNILRNPRGVVRLVGLSGVGKTRLVQALFDNRIGDQNLDPNLAAYTSLPDGLAPAPSALASQLIAERTRAVLIVDNCAPDLHHRLSEVCRANESSLSLITIEYDIREDQPEGTEVFVLEPASVNLTETLIKSQFPQLSSLDARRIAEFSGGNARVAIALAGSVGRSESIGQLSEEHLFQRLFHQRNEPDEALFIGAQVLALVYSFQGEDVSDDERSELSVLGKLIGKSAEDMFRFAAELERRGLIQRRSRWRAVLPHAIANRLASRALENIPAISVERCFLADGRERLLKSFSRRLTYLHGSREAKSIATGWLGPDGLLQNLPELNDLGQAILNNIAPVVPEETLTALERALRGQTDSEQVGQFKPYVRLLRNLAYDAALFERCTELVAEIASADNSDQNEARRAFTSLFPVMYSGTHATIDQRLTITNAYLSSPDAKERTLGSAALKAMLATAHFSVTWDFEFGARSRDYGYWPHTREDVRIWFSRTLELAKRVVCSDEPAASQVREIVAEQFRGLWGYAAMYDELERTCNAIVAKGFWKEGWVAVRQTIHFDSQGFTPSISARLASLEKLLRPNDLIERVRAVVLSQGLQIAGMDSSDDQSTEIPYEKVEAAAESLGREVATDENIFARLLPELMGDHDQLWRFGKGLGQASATPRRLWEYLVAAFAGAKGGGGMQLLRGFLNGLKGNDAELADKFVGDAVGDERVAFAYPVLQTAVGIDETGVQRLLESLELGKAPIQNYHCLVMGGVTHSIPNEGFRRLLLRIADKPGGLSIAIEILYMRLAHGQGHAQSSRAEIIDIGCELMRKLTFSHEHNQLDAYRLGQIARVCLEGPRGSETVREICRKLKDAVLKYETYAFQQKELLDIIMSAQPLAALDALCGGDETDLRSGMSLLQDASLIGRNPFDSILEADLLAWCEQQPNSRYPAIAAGVTAYQFEGDRPHWTSIARKLLDKAPDRVAVAKQFISKFTPMAWAGSRAAIVEANTKLLDDLATYRDVALTEFIAAEKIRLRTVIQEERDMQFLLDRDRDERFEW